MWVTFLSLLFNYLDIYADSTSFPALSLFYILDFPYSEYSFRP